MERNFLYLCMCGTILYVVAVFFVAGDVLASEPVSDSTDTCLCTSSLLHL